MFQALGQWCITIGWEFRAVGGGARAVPPGPAPGGCTSMVMGSQVRWFSSTYTALSQIHRWSGCRLLCAREKGSSPMAPRARPAAGAHPRQLAGRSGTLYNETARAGAPGRQGGRRPDVRKGRGARQGAGRE